MTQSVRRRGAPLTLSAIGLSIPALALALSLPAHGATVAVIDSGLDYKHKTLAPKNIWSNPGEVPDNGVDDDHNGYVDDIYGWNFADSSNEVIDYSFLGTFPEDCYRYFDIQAKTIKGTATDEEKAWLKKKRGDEAFIADLSTFGNFVHGTHVAGIATESRTTEKVLGLKIIPTKPPTMGSVVAKLAAEGQAKQHFANLMDDGGDGDDPLTQAILEGLLNQAVDNQVAMLNSAGAYAAAAKADVANGSFGTSPKAVKPAIEKILTQLLGKAPTPAMVDKYSRFLAEKILEKSREFVQKAPDTLFVFAAGNDGTDNDVLPVSPANLGEPNSITVAATLDRAKLASFSNFGAKMVDVAAPGVAIRSTIPGDAFLAMSGTSMAAPHVTDVAALVKDANRALKPADIKRILVETVDAKDFLRGKIKSGGIVNDQRAVTAASLAKSLPLSDAIARAKAEVADMPAPAPGLTGLDDSLIAPLALPSFVQL